MLQEEVSTFLTLPAIAGVIITYVLVATLYYAFDAPQPPASVPWQGYGRGWISSIRNYVALSKSKEWLLDGYEKYSKNNKIFILPPTLGMPAEIVFPRSQMRWLLDQPDSVISTSEAHYDILQGDYSFVEPIILKDPYHEHVIHKNLVRNLNSTSLHTVEEIPISIDSIFGTDSTTYKKFDIMESFFQVVPSITNRMMVGPSICREQRYLDAVLSFTKAVIRTQLVMLLCPKAFHPIIGRLLGLTSTYHYWISSRFTLPLIKKRFEELRKKDSAHPDYKDWKEPQDFITWSYRTAQAEGRLDEMQPVRVAERILPLNFAAIHTTTITAYETLANVLSADPSVLEGLREEVHRVHREERGWTKQGFSRMHRLDSTIRESQRVAPIALTFIHRKVIAKEGITTPEGAHLKYGTLITCPWAPVALDEEIHDKNASEFDAFRYSRAKEAYDEMTPEEKHKANALELRQTGMVTTSDRHLPFGHGRHACPGRFFVSHELKMIFAYLILNYDFKHHESKPEKMWVYGSRA
ncbi:cytochrome P450 [Phaeosphaeriaceae sp. SRC1lsM3a]|nr:cytochrome P450 [Stagonospora sp. SRC1lsM3a]